ncbi:MAG TPA: methyltransferase domain-containing protein [Rhizomicrobium sp.]|nr:methyltransferase domain-containing protein [Rhizomicrobium sp.]
MRGPPRIFDRKLYSQRRARASGTDFLVKDAAAHMCERIRALKPVAQAALDLSSRPEAFAELESCAVNWTRTSSHKGLQLCADEESLPFGPHSFDLVTSVFGLHAVNDLPGALIQIRKILKPGGLLVAAMFGGETLRELRDSFAAAESELSGGASPRVSPFADVRDLGALLQRAGFAGPVADVERTVVRYSRFESLLRDLRELGETNVLQQRSRKFLRRDVLAAMLSHYTHAHADTDEKLRATFDVIYLTGLAPTN